MEAVVSLGETLGIIAKPKDVAEMKGGNFMWVRVCSGRYKTTV